MAERMAAPCRPPPRKLSTTGHNTADAADPHSAAAHSSSSRRGSSTGASATTPHRVSVPISTARGDSRRSRARSSGPACAAVSAYNAPMAAARIRLRTGENP
jgi:hypothetical protein